MLLKVFIVLILVGYIFHKITSFIFKGIFKGFTGRDQFGQQQYSRNSRRAPNSDLNIDKVPKGRSKKEDGFEGGEYVDYEEVK